MANAYRSEVMPLFLYEVLLIFPPPAAPHQHVTLTLTKYVCIIVVSIQTHTHSQFNHGPTLNNRNTEPNQTIYNLCVQNFFKEYFHSVFQQNELYNNKKNKNIKKKKKKKKKKK